MITILNSHVYQLCFSFATFILLSMNTYGQERFTLSGLVKSAKSGEKLIGTTVLIQETQKKVSTNDYGFYSLQLTSGPHTLLFVHVGMNPKTIQLDVVKDSVINVSLDEAGKSLEAVEITAARARSLSNPQMGAERLSIAETKNIPVLFGEQDILKVIQMLPGIKSAGDGNSGFYVRGGASDQNLILLDEAPVYNPSHALGFFSTFNSEAIKDITVYKGGMPANYGGRLSSVLDIKMKDGNTQNFQADGGVGLISAKLNLEGPIVKDKSSFLISGRRTYADLFLKLSGDSSINRNTIYFYDLNAKLNFKLGDKDHLYISGYYGRDQLGVNESFQLNWGNTTGTVRWNHIFSNKLFSNTALVYSNYDYNIELKSGANDFNIFSQIRDLNLKQEFQWYLNEKNNIRFGVNAIYHTIRPGEISTPESSSYNSRILEKRYALENSAFISNNQTITDRLSFSYGLRLSAFSVLGKGTFADVNTDGQITGRKTYGAGEIVKTYYNLEPRFAASYLLTQNTSLKASYVRNVQNLHLIANSTTSTPTDKWIASSNVVKPELSDQVSLGYYRNFADNQFELTVETYYKTMQNQIDYRNGADILSNEVIETQLLYGKGRAYGVEWLFKKKTGNFIGWISYTLSKTQRQIQGINNGHWYNARQDRPHDIAIVGTYKLSDKWSVSANWIFYNGDAVSFPNGKYSIDNQTIYYYTERNSYRMPSYHRLDLGANMQLRKRKNYTSELSFSLYNAYGRENAYTIEFRDSKTNPGETEAVRTALFRYIPSVSYNFKFR